MNGNFNQHMLDFEKLFTSLRRITMNQKERSIDGVNYSRTQLEILMLLDEKSCQTAKDLAEQLLVTGGAIAQTVETLVKRDLVVRVQDKSDHRFIQLVLTQKGNRVVEKYCKARRDFMNLLVLGLTESEIDAVLNVTKKASLLIFNRESDQLDNRQ
jgi:DNA-binding MarR family transcriptional regulator